MVGKARIISRTSVDVRLKYMQAGVSRGGYTLPIKQIYKLWFALYVSSSVLAAHPSLPM